MITCPAATSSQNNALAGYTVVPAAILAVLPDSRINIYVADESKKRPILFRASDYCLTREQWKQFQDEYDADLAAQLTRKREGCP